MGLASTWRSRAAVALCQQTGIRDAEEAIDAAVDRLLEEAGENGPRADLEVLASFRGVREVNHAEMQEAGRLLPVGAGYVIEVNAVHPAGKQRFTVAHEICHTLFNEAEQATGGTIDAETGLFNPKREEEYLCDRGAGRLLLHPSWLGPLATDRTASVDTLLELSELCGASLEATAFQLARLALWPCTVVCWEPGLRKAERVRPAQLGLPGVPRPTPVEKLRARRVYAPPAGLFIPLNKSVDEGTPVHMALVEQGRAEGEITFALGGQPVRAWSQSLYAPYQDGDTTRPRVLSCLVPLSPPRRDVGLGSAI